MLSPYLNMNRIFDFHPEDLLEKEKAIQKKIGGFSLLRLALFVAIGAFAVLFFSDAFYWIFPAGLAVWSFIWAIQQHNFLKDQVRVYHSLSKIQQERVLRERRNLKSLDSGSEFLDKDHPFSNDLDLFGEHSLFQLVNHTHSNSARNLLASRLKSQLDVKNGFRLHGAVSELALKEDLLRSFEAIGKAFFNEKEQKIDWSDWMNQSVRMKPYLLVLGWVGLLGGLTTGTLAYLGLFPSQFLGIWILLGLPFLGMVFKELKEAGDRIPSQTVLKTYKHWLFLLEAEKFDNSILRDHQDKLMLPEGPSTSKLLEELDRLSLWIQNRMNLLYIPLNLFFWTDLLIYYRWAKWKNNWGKEIASLPDELAYWELLISLAIFEREEAQLGSWEVSDKMEFEAKGIFHPLLEPKTAVANDFSVDQSGKLILLTGANMSGKTTFMRTLGINLVLVNLGLSPFAKFLRLGVFKLYTSMRNSDNLGQSISSFYAELSRIKGMIDRLENGERLFFLLDEILKGTNTEDRIAGSEALIRQLAMREFLGIISTHDIELSRLESKIPYLRNFSFHSQIHENTIDFDYLIKPGPCPSFNAHKLMELMGIRFEEKS
ncbi:MutS-related protein [Algoriphagus limi]|uniref:DNA mismatch repair protein n=1 Tax=Algoriphagus limi TaxID=2975273 RepID=A0ABT2G7G0_9BACT|nr:DNA mismatch repair protein [Algoriphagus limi]MCS5491203.1 DNA mismatch repair protein [Algoriphagus limi]